MDQQIGRVILPLARRRSDGSVDLLGTCFAVSATKFATAAHVIGPSDVGLCMIFGRLDSVSEYQDTTDKTANVVDMKLSAYNPVRDVSIIEISDGKSSVSFGYSIVGTDSIGTGSPVASFGFPHADTGRLVLTQQLSMVGARILLGNNGVKTKHVVLNTQTRPGQSGGPVFSPDGKKVHAMVLGSYAPSQLGISLGGIDPQTLHQTTHAVSAEYIKEMI